MRITAVTCVKNEGPFLLEWIAFNRVTGIGDHLFYSNNCTDGTDLLLDALADVGICTHLPNPAQGRNYQMEALKAARKHRLVKDADWVWIADVDEFPCIHMGEPTRPGTWADLITACESPHAISLSFQFFANAGIVDFEDRPVISQFVKSHHPDIWTNQKAIEVKTLLRADVPWKYFGAHRPFLKDQRPEGLRWCDGSGRPVPEAFVSAANPRRLRRFPAKGARAWASLNHYALRSRDSYLVKTDRGDVNRENRAFDTAYWRARNDAGRTDRAILRYLPKLHDELRRLKALPRIADLHAHCVEAHRAKCADLMAQADVRAMAETLCGSADRTADEDAFLQSLGAPVLEAG